MIEKVKRVIIGKALRNDELFGEKYSAFWGLPILSSDAISSVAYAGEEILWVLVPVIGLQAYQYMFYVALAIVVLLFILVFSYQQTIDSYPNGGGSYIVAKDNLGTIPGLVAGSSLLIDYILTVAVSTSAGTAAITSMFPVLLPHKVSIALFLILFMTIGNLRGLKESSRLFGTPTYIFIVSMLIMIITGIFKVYVLGYHPHSIVHNLPTFTSEVTIFLILRAFAAGCTALTGVEAVSNGIPNFREPSQKNAKHVLIALGFFVLVIFGGTSYLATLYQAIPTMEKTVVSQIAIQVFGNSFMFYVIQITTAIILVMAANTAFSDLPLLLSLIARDGYAPRQFSQRGERLSFSNGIILLAILASVLIILFRGETHLLLPLYAVGVFLSFTLSQTGMFIKWIREKKSGWIHKAIINGFGAIVTFITVIIIGSTKFIHGAWIVLILVPIFVYVMLNVKKHYDRIAVQLSLPYEEYEKELASMKNTHYIIVPINSFNKASLKALNYAMSVSDNVTAFHVSLNEESTNKLVKKWKDFNIKVPLVIKECPYRDLLQPLINYIKEQEHHFKEDEMITIVLPQFIVKKSIENVLHNQTAIFIKGRLLRDRNVAVITVPYVLK